MGQNGEETTTNSAMLNGKTLYYSFLAGANQVIQHQIDINNINVFPVNDKDTGTNLAATVRFVLDSIKPEKSYKAIVNAIAQAALVGARGNSGIIFAQFLYGLSCETKNKTEINMLEFAESVSRSVPYMYRAISNPVEGTMLTIINEWAQYLHSKREQIGDFKNVIIASSAVLEKSLAATTARLEVLKESNLVDAGAKGFVLFMKGVIDFIKVGDIKQLVLEPQTPHALLHPEHPIDEEINYRYCTEAIVKNVEIAPAELQHLVGKWGDSVVIAGSQATCRMHLHTNLPAEFFQELRKIGTITFQKVDDMVRQQQMATKRKWNIALVTDSACDLAQELIDHYQINVVPLNLNFGENHFLDKVTIKPNRFYDMLETEAAFPKSSQINEQAFTNLYSHLATHYDAVIAIHLTSQFSGTFGNSLKAAKRITEEFAKPIHVIDSKNLSGGLGLLVLKAAQLIETNHSADEVVSIITEDIGLTKIFVSVRDLNSMIRGGRVSKPKGFIASLLGFNPVISMDEAGKSLLFGNTFSQQASLRKVMSHIQHLSSQKKVWNYIVLHAQDVAGAENAAQEMVQLTGKKAASIVDISPIIGMHAGKGAIAISLLLTN